MVAGVIQLCIGMPLALAGILMLVNPRIADRFYDISNRRVADALSVSQSAYDRNRATSRRLVPAVVLILGVAFIVLGSLAVA